MNRVTAQNIRRFEYEFIGYGQLVNPKDRETNCIYLDVGNNLAPGIIDHHQLASYAGSAAGLIVLHPNLVCDAIDNCGDKSPVRFVLHENPDLDCLVSAYLAGYLCTNGCLCPSSQKLASYTNRIDQGMNGFCLDRPFTLYTAFVFLAHRLSRRYWERREDLFRYLIQEGMRLVGYIDHQSAKRNCAVDEVDAFVCPGLFGEDDKQALLHDREKYNKKLFDESCHARKIKISLPCNFGGSEKVDGLIVRDVQNERDAQRVLFFKDWARTDTINAPGKHGFTFLAVMQSTAIPDRRRAIVSVRRDSQVSLKGLGERFEKAEVVERTKLFQKDDRLFDTQGNRLPNRKGYDNPDPWYDGRGHAYTIVDSPRSGTVLGDDFLQRLIIEFGNVADGAGEPVEIEFNHDQSFTNGDLHKIGLLAAPLLENKIQNLKEAPDIFISYSRKKMEWVEENIYKPLVETYGSQKVFLDRNMRAGTGWIPTLADAIMGCRMFVALYCKEYFESLFCNWELQLAMLRDPAGARGTIVPFMLDDCEIPNCYGLIHARDARRNEFSRELEEVTKDNMTQNKGK